jgi:hypothetical protein
VRAEKVVRGFASATNLLIAGRRFAVHGRGPVASELTALLARLGAIVGPTAPVNYVFCTGEQAPILNVFDLPAHAAQLVIIDATPHASLELIGFHHDRLFVRGNVERLIVHGEDAFLVRVDALVTA